MAKSKRKTVVITGGTRGIGRAIGELFHSRGYRVAASSSSARQKDLPKDFLHHQGDVRRRADQFFLASEVYDRFGSIDVWINAAGVSRWRPIAEIDERFAEDVIDTSLLGTLWGCAAASSVLKRGGAIVNLSSLAGKRGSSNNSAYCAAKFAVNGITQSLAKELGPRGIRVNAVCPVYVKTKHILDSLADPVSPAGGKDIAAYFKSFAATQTALGRLPLASEVATTVFFLASDEASAITGQCLNVDCGTLPQ